MSPVQIRFIDDRIVLFRMYKMAIFSVNGRVTGEKRIPFLTADILPLKEML